MSSLDDLLLVELKRRSRLNALVRERADAIGEADKLHIKAAKPGGNPALAAESDRWRTVAGQIALEIEVERTRLREAEAVIAAARGGQPPAGA